MRKGIRKKGRGGSLAGDRDDCYDATGVSLGAAFAEELGFGCPTASPEVDEAMKASMRPELPELLGALRQLRQRLAGVQAAVRTLSERTGCDEEDAGGNDSGELVGSAAYVGMKAQMMLAYIVNLSYYLLLKVRGVPVRDHPVVLRLLWIRTLFEKLRPVDQRLHYQMNKLLQLAETKSVVDSVEAADPLTLRPGELAATVEDKVFPAEGQGDGAIAKEDGVRGTDDAEDDGLYKPPRIAMVEYTGDHVTEQERAERDLERKKHHFARSELVRSLREEFTDTPAEVRDDHGSAAAAKATRKLVERQMYEEENLSRLRPSKLDRREQKRLLRHKHVSGGTVSLNDVADFSELSKALKADGVEQQGRRGRRGGRSGGGSALQEYDNAAQRARAARQVVDSTLGSSMPMSAGKRRRGGGLDEGVIDRKRRK